jgi:hypothetical protein
MRIFFESKIQINATPKFPKRFFFDRLSGDVKDFARSNLDQISMFKMELPRILNPKAA